MRQEADSDFFCGVGVGDCFLLFALPGLEELLAGFIVQAHGAAGFGYEVAGCDLPAVDERERQAIAPPGAKFFKHILGQAEPAGAVAVQEASVRVQSYCLQCRADFLAEQGVGPGY